VVKGVAVEDLALKLAMAELDLRLHWTLAGIVALVDACFVALTIYFDKVHHVEPPSSGIDTSATIGWISVLGGCFAFGCYGILMKTPSVEQVKCDCMVFQCYSSVAVVVVSMVIWAIAGSSAGLTFTGSSFSMGVLFAALWIYSQICGFNAVQAIGYAVAPAIWIGVTITGSFLWGVLAFHTPVSNWPGAIAAIVLMISGVILAAYSSTLSDEQESKASGKHMSLTEESTKDSSDEEEEQRESAEDSSVELPDAGGSGDEDTVAGVGSFGLGVVYACLIGICNGSLMMPMTCFQIGCPSIGVEAYTGDALAPLAFLPSLACGILVAHPILFLMYWGRSMLAGTWPQFHFKEVALPALLTGSFWGMGNFGAMFATVYLGQVVGFPLTQCCLIISGSWGIFYFKEIRGMLAIGTFMVASVLLLAGASLDGMSV